MAQASGLVSQTAVVRPHTVLNACLPVLGALHTLSRFSTQCWVGDTILVSTLQKRKWGHREVSNLPKPHSKEVLELGFQSHQSTVLLPLYFNRS